MEQPLELPLNDQQLPPERADAVRNRARILAAAERLFADRGAGCVSMDEVADAAGVGKGTLFRRFGSRAALALALLSEHESEFQEGFIRGEPPLGPGATPLQRLIAFGEGRFDLLEAHSDVLAVAEVGSGRLSSAPYAVYRLHVTLLLREAAPACDPRYLVEALLAALGPEEFLHARHELGLSLEQLKAGWCELVTRLVSPLEAQAEAAAAAERSDDPAGVAGA